MICSVSSCCGWKWSSEELSCSSVTFTLQEALGSGQAPPRGTPYQASRPGAAGVGTMNSSITLQGPNMDLGLREGGSPWPKRGR